ncbi:MAG: hypothetical protein JWL65_874 [Gammaproteobacteria bacterium]|nr:hypothetical protein [Gammaproteobacteria bacterium]
MELFPRLADRLDVPTRQALSKGGAPAYAQLLRAEPRGLAGLDGDSGKRRPTAQPRVIWPHQQRQSCQEGGARPNIAKRRSL